MLVVKINYIMIRISVRDGKKIGNICERSMRMIKLCSVGFKRELGQQIIRIQTRKSKIKVLVR